METGLLRTGTKGAAARQAEPLRLAGYRGLLSLCESEKGGAAIPNYQNGQGERQTENGRDRGSFTVPSPCVPVPAANTYGVGACQ